MVIDAAGSVDGVVEELEIRSTIGVCALTCKEKDDSYCRINLNCFFSKATHPSSSDL